MMSITTSMDLSNIFYLNIEKEYQFPLGTPIQAVDRPEPRNKSENGYLLSLRPEQFDRFMNGIRQAIRCVGVICLEMDARQIITLFQLPDLLVYIGMPTKELLVSTLTDPQEAKKHMDSERKILNIATTLESMLVSEGSPNVEN